MNYLANNPLKLLLIDDDEDEFVLLKDMCSSVHRVRFEIDWCDTPEKALALAGGEDFDVFLVDYRLGPANGLDLVKELNNRRVKAPIILLTGQGNYEIDEAAQAAGAADYLAKDDLSFSILERTIRYAIEHKDIQVNLERRVQERTQALQESEARFRGLTETTSAAIFIVRDMKIRYANPATKIVTGYDPESLVGEDFLKLIHLEHHASLEQYGLGNPWAPGLPNRYEMKIIRADGNERWLDLTTGPVEYEGAQAWIVTAFDITERDIAEKELRKARDELEMRVEERTLQLRQANERLQVSMLEIRKRADEIEALRNATSMLLASLDLNTLLGNILEAARRAIPTADKGAIHLITSKTGKLSLRAAIGINPEKDQKSRFLLKSGYPTEVLSSGKALIVSDLAPKEGKTARTKLDDRSLIAAPLLLEDAPFGVLLLTCSCVDAFNERDLALLETFADTASVAIRNAQVHGEVQQMAITDPLTGALNRRGFMQTSERELERFHRYGHPLSMIYLDVDKFKSINDLHGHPAGDKVLRAVVQRSRQQLRHLDIIGRIGGDEFAILLPETSLPKARRIAERIRQAVADTPVPVQRKKLQISTTMGVTQVRESVDHMDTLMATADKALYEAKHQGRNRVAVG